MKVTLIPTGVMEYTGLARALERLFPSHEFSSVPRIPPRPGVKEEVYSQSNTYRVSSDIQRGIRSWPSSRAA